MPNDTHDVSLPSLFVDGVAHRLSVDRKALVFRTEGRIPLLQGVVEFDGINTDQHVTDDRFTRNDIAFLFAATTEAFSGLGAEVFCPFGDGFVATHAAQGCAGRDAQHHTESMTAAFGSTGVRDVLKEVGQGTHLLCCQHNLGYSSTVKGVKDGAGELCSCVMLQRPDKDQLG